MTAREQSAAATLAEPSDETLGADEQPVALASFTSGGEIPPVSTDEPIAHAASASDRGYANHHHDRHHRHGYSAHHEIPGGARNVSMVHINNHPGRDSTGKHPQYTRVSVHGHTPKLARRASVYTSDGHKIGDMGGGEHVNVNSGQICHLKIEGHDHPVACVLGHGSPPGWIPVHAFEHHQKLADIQHAQAHRISHQQHNDRHDHGTPHTIRNRPIPANIDKLFTKSPQHSETANHAHDYYIRGDGRANLLLNMPTWDEHGHCIGERFGSASDVVQTAELGAEPTREQVFHQTGGHTAIPLFKHRHTTQVNHITFVYGYVVNSAGEHRYGWMNKHLLD